MFLSARDRGRRLVGLVGSLVDFFGRGFPRPSLVSLCGNFLFGASTVKCLNYDYHFGLCLGLINSRGRKYAPKPFSTKYTYAMVRQTA